MTKCVFKYLQPGFKCTDCSTALHCFPGNFALLIQCAGRLPYCSNGYCSAEKAERCVKEPSKYKPAGDKNKLKEPNNTATSTITARAKRNTKRYF